MNIQDEPQTRARGEALRDVDYVIRLGVIHHRLFCRLESGARFVQLLGGSAAVGGAIAGSTVGTGIAGLVVALAAYADIAFEFGKAARLHDQLIRRASQVAERAARKPSMTSAQIDMARAAAADLDVTIIEALRTPAYNEVQRRHGLYSYVRPLSRWQRFMEAIA